MSIIIDSLKETIKAILFDKCSDPKAALLDVYVSLCGTKDTSNYTFRDSFDCVIELSWFSSTAAGHDKFVYFIDQQYFKYISAIKYVRSTKYPNRSLQEAKDFVDNLPKVIAE